MHGFNVFNICKDHKLHYTIHQVKVADVGQKFKMLRIIMLAYIIIVFLKQVTVLICDLIQSQSRI